MRNGRVKPGDRILLMGFGGGLVSAGSVLIWG
ncbi:MAG: 3-oxoacyl-[acyl-carrier-protein] synthase III C-terminal domain-containing protein [Vulcanimicrobiaceae bacterium]